MPTLPFCNAESYTLQKVTSPDDPLATEATNKHEDNLSKLILHSFL
mgnify:FL=1